VIVPPWIVAHRSLSGGGGAAAAGAASTASSITNTKNINVRFKYYLLGRVV